MPNLKHETRGRTFVFSTLMLALMSTSLLSANDSSAALRRLEIECRYTYADNPHVYVASALAEDGQISMLSILTEQDLFRLDVKAVGNRIHQITVSDPEAGIEAGTSDQSGRKRLRAFLKLGSAKQIDVGCQVR